MGKGDGWSVGVWIDLDQIDPRPASEVRVSFDRDAAAEYAEMIGKLPPLDVFRDADDTHRLGDGRHRYEGLKAAGAKQALCRVKPGGYAEAYAHACHANDKHGIRTSNADKRRRVEVALKHFPDRSNRAIAEICGVDHKTVIRLRPEPEVGNLPTLSPTVTGRDGKRYPGAGKKTSEPKGRSAKPFANGSSPQPATSQSSVEPKPEPNAPPAPKPVPTTHPAAKAEVSGTPEPPPLAPAKERAPAPVFDDIGAFDLVIDFAREQLESWPPDRRSSFAMKLYAFAKRLFAELNISSEGNDNEEA